jgi:hypothetical protein
VDESPKARAYEALYPNTGISEAQKEDRMERLAFKGERRSLRRTSRTRGVMIPRLPWKED